MSCVSDKRTARLASTLSNPASEWRSVNKRALKSQVTTASPGCHRLSGMSPCVGRTNGNREKGKRRCAHHCRADSFSEKKLAFFLHFQGKIRLRASFRSFYFFFFAKIIFFPFKTRVAPLLGNPLRQMKIGKLQSHTVPLRGSVVVRKCKNASLRRRFAPEDSALPPQETPSKGALRCTRYPIALIMPTTGGPFAKGDPLELQGESPLFFYSRFF